MASKVVDMMKVEYYDRLGWLIVALKEENGERTTDAFK